MVMTTLSLIKDVIQCRTVTWSIWCIMMKMNSMEHSPPWEDDNCSASQEIPCLL